MRLPWLVVQSLTVGVACDKTCELTSDNTCAESNILYNHGVLPVVGRVPREEWDYENPNFRDELALRTTPVIITNSPVASWKAVSEWDLKSIVDKVGKNTVIYITDSKDGSFLYHSDSKAERLVYHCVSPPLAMPLNASPVHLICQIICLRAHRLMD